MLWIILFSGVAVLATVYFVWPKRFKGLKTRLIALWTMISGGLVEILGNLQWSEGWHSLVSPEVLPLAIVGLGVVYFGLRQVTDGPPRDMFGGDY